MEKFKICLLNDSFPPLIDGVANTVVNYADILQKEELADPFVVTPFFPGSEDYKFSFPVVRYKSLNIGNMVEGYRAGIPFNPRLLSNVIDRKPDIIHTHCPFVSTIVARELKSKIKAPVVFTYHTKFDVDIAKTVKYKVIQKDITKFMIRNISACDEVWVVSKGAGENLRSLGYNGDYIVMNNGVDFPKGKQEQALVDQITNEYNLKANIPVFLFVGRLFWYKGIKLIVDALKRLSDEHDFRMLVVGKGQDEDEIKSYVRELGLEEKFIFTGAIYDREKLRSINSRADLFLFPSTYDTNGLVVREAAACGLSSLIIKDSCASEGICDGVNGFSCEEDAYSMYMKIKEIIKDMDYLHQVGDRAMDEVYISWKDSITRANERYHIIHERKQSGMLYPDKTGFSDRVYHLSTKMLLITKRNSD